MLSSLFIGAARARTRKFYIEALISATLLVSTSAFAQIHINNINIVDVRSGKIIQSQHVTVTGNKIVSIKSKRPKPYKNSITIDGTGKYLIPGLWDMHMHGGDLAYVKGTIIPCMLANGITGYRNMWGYASDLPLRDSVSAGLLVAPRMVIGTPIIDGPHSVFKTIKVANPDKVPGLIDSLQRVGFDFIKTYQFLSNEVFDAIAHECRKRQLPFAGHTPIGATVEHASNQGLHSIEHMIGITRAFSNREDSIKSAMVVKSAGMRRFADFANVVFENDDHRFGIDSAKAERVSKQLAANNTAVVPTLSIYRGYHFHPDSLEKIPSLDYVSAGMRSYWNKARKAGQVDTMYLQSQIRNLAMLHRHGVMILAGTDNNNSYVVQGFALHDELRWYVQAGMSNTDALRTATLNPAIFLGRDHELGSVEVNKLADLVILNANPLDDIENTKKIQAVIANGKLLSRQELDEMLVKVKAQLD